MRSFGSVDQRSTGRWRARYNHKGVSYAAPVTFETRRLAERWLAVTDADIQRGTWEDPKAAPVVEVKAETFETYATRWIVERGLRPRTVEQYECLLRIHIIPVFGQLALAEVTASAVRTWMARTAPPTVKAHAYVLMSSIMKTAVQDDLVEKNPCAVRKGGQAPTVKKGYEASNEELDKLRAALPDRFKAMVDVGVYASLRFGEATALRRSDIDLDLGTLRVRQGVVRVKGQGLIAGPPKTAAGVRTVWMPTRLTQALAWHLDRYVPAEPDTIVFSTKAGKLLSHSAMQRWWNPARDAAGLPDTFTYHQLRHTGQSKAAGTGATMAELMERAGQSSPQAALRYIHSSATRQREIAARMDLT